MKIRVVLFSFLLIACGPRHEPPPFKENTGDNQKKEQELKTLLENPEQIVFDDVYRLVLESKCAKCHNPTDSKIANVDVTSLESLLGAGAKKTVSPFNAEDSSLFETLLLPHEFARHMPPAGEPQVSEDEKNLLYQWILMGAKAKVSQVTKRPKTLLEKIQPYFDEPEKIDYSTVKKYVFDTSCTDCHSAHGSKAGQDGAMIYGPNMTDYEGLFNNFAIVPGMLVDKFVSDGEGGKKKVRGSRIFSSIAIKQSMPIAEQGYLPVDSLRIKLLRLWILNCAIKDFSEIADDSLQEKSQDGKIRNCEE